MNLVCLLSNDCCWYCDDEVHCDYFRCYTCNRCALHSSLDGRDEYCSADHRGFMYVEGVLKDEYRDLSEEQIVERALQNKEIGYDF